MSNIKMKIQTFDGVVYGVALPHWNGVKETVFQKERMMEKSELLGCPFCGELAAPGVTNVAGKMRASIKCNGCGASITGDYDSVKDFNKAINALSNKWNTRTTPTPAPLSLEDLKQADNMPVWTVTTGVDGSGRWELLSWHVISVSPYHPVIKCTNLLDGECDYPLDTYGKTWNAFTTKPAGKEGEG